MIGVFQQESLKLFNIVEDVTKKYLNQSSRHAGFFKLPPNAHNLLRKQYNAITILNHIATKNRGKFDLKIGLVDVDIYTRGMNFIFGLADPSKKTALVSTYRLTGNKMAEHISKEVIHEIGHLLDLRHCSNPKCVMHFSNTLNDTENKDVIFCKECRREIG
jgi:archaemetzincin